MLYELLIVSVPLTRFCDKRDIEGPTSAYSRIGKFAQHTTVRIGDASAERRYTSSYADIGTFFPFCNKPPQRDIHRELDDIC
jgi:hypothetical protein